MDINIEKMTDETVDRGQDSISILFLLQETISLFTKSFVSCKANEEMPSSTNMWAEGGRSSDANDKMNQACYNNDWDITNDIIKFFVGAGTETQNTLRVVEKQH